VASGVAWHRNIGGVCGWRLPGSWRALAALARTRAENVHRIIWRLRIVTALAHLSRLTCGERRTSVHRPRDIIACGLWRRPRTSSLRPICGPYGASSARHCIRRRRRDSASNVNAGVAGLGESTRFHHRGAGNRRRRKVIKASGSWQWRNIGAWPVEIGVSMPVNERRNGWRCGGIWRLVINIPII